MKSLNKIKENAQTKVKALNLNSKEAKETVLKYVKKFSAKAKGAKTFNILSNVALSSYLLACVLPDAQYFFREKVLGTKLEPDLI